MIILFFSILDEKQRRLLAGLEALKLGHGGDSHIADLLGIDTATVAKGRKELLGGNVNSSRQRQLGAGRPSQEKKLRRSSKKSARPVMNLALSAATGWLKPWTVTSS